MRITSSLPVASLAVFALVLGPSPSPARASVPTGDPTFSDPLHVDNAWFPFVVRRIRLYEQTAGPGNLHAIDVFLPETRTFHWNGDDVACRVLQEWEVEDGEVVEISRNYVAQSDDGTVWYFGETVDTYEGGVVTGHQGSWLVGGPGAGDPAETIAAERPTILMPGSPEPGDVWKSEDLPDEGIEEFDEALRFVNQVKTPDGTFDDTLLVEERTPDVERKWYAPGVGFVKGKETGETLSLEEIADSSNTAAMEDALEGILEDLAGGA